MAKSKLNKDLLKRLSVGDIFEHGSVFGNMSDEKLVWQVLSKQERNGGNDIRVEFQTFYYDVPMGRGTVKYLNGKIAGELK